jgi:hypothetical protein
MLLVVLTAAPQAQAFDIQAYRAQAEKTLTELNAKRLPDPDATLARLDEMMAMGIGGIKEYAAKQPKYAKLMNAAVADAPAMKQMTDVQLEDKWGEKGTAGDAVGVPLKTLSDMGVQRAYLELVVGPAHQYIFIKKYQTTKKARWLEEARDEAVELIKHLESLSPE